MNDVIGLDSVKRQLRRIVNVKGKKKIHCLISGQAGLSKTHILKCLQKELTDQQAKVKYIDSSTASRSGIFDVLFEGNVNYLLSFAPDINFSTSSFALSIALSEALPISVAICSIC